MKIRTTVKTMKTACGKTVSYLCVDGQVNKMHSIEGPAVIYPEADNKASEYYLYGIKYSKAEWKERVSQSKSTVVVESPFNLEY